MLASSIPSKISTPFANSGTKNTIPVPSQTGGASPWLASFTDGFPPLTRTPIASGGIPPEGADMNGILYQITAVQQWQSAGGVFKYDSAFSTAIGGYPAGAILLSSNGVTQWLSLADNNTSDPDAGGANWAALSGYGITAVTGLTNSNVTLTAAQYGKSIITLAGTLTGNVQIIFPTTQQRWLVLNNTSGAFTVTCKTASGTGGTIPTGGVQEFYGDGTNLVPFGYDSRYALAGAVTSASSVGAFSNLASSANGTSSTVSVTCDEIVLEDSSNAYKTVRAVSVSINTASTGANGLDTGTLATNTWYAVWLISNGTTTSGLISLSATAPTLPGGYTYKARIGWIRTDGTGNKYPLSFIQKGRIFQYKVDAGSNVTAMPIFASGALGSVNAPTFVSSSLSNYLPPTASRLFFTVAINSSGTAIVAPNSNFGAYTSTSNAPPFAYSPGSTTSSVIQGSLLLESSNVFLASSIGGTQFYSTGWEDNL